MLADLNESYNAKQGKAWGFFHAESGAYPFSGWLKEYLDGGQDFTAFSRTGRRAPAEADGRIQPVHRRPRAVRPLPARHDRLPGHRPAAPQRRRGGDRRAGRDAVAPPGPGPVAPGGADQRVSEWQNNKQSKQYISFIKGKNGKKVSEYFRDFIGCQEGVDGPGETRTLLKAFSDFVESEDLPEEHRPRKDQDPGRTTPAARPSWASRWAWKNCRG